jgi:hypothetical protein
MSDAFGTWERAVGIVAAVAVGGAALVYGPVPPRQSETGSASPEARPVLSSGSIGGTRTGVEPLGFGLSMGPGSPYQVVDQGCADSAPPAFFAALEADARRSGLVSGEAPGSEDGPGTYWRQEHGDLVVLSRLRKAAEGHHRAEPELTLTFGHRSGDCGTRWQTLSRRAGAEFTTPGGVAPVEDGLPMPPFVHELFRGAAVGAAGLRLYGTHERPDRIAAWFRVALREGWHEEATSTRSGRSSDELLRFTRDGRYCLISIDDSNQDETTVVVMMGADPRRVR